MLKLGLIGKGIQRTQANFLHCLLGEMIGQPVSYDLIDTSDFKDFSLIDQLKQCADTGYRGVNVTHPYKQQAFELTNPFPSLPKYLHSVNTVIFDGDEFTGGNTDWSGFMKAYCSYFGSTHPGRVFMIGAGGVGNSLAFALASLGATQLKIYDSRIQQAEELVGLLISNGFDALIAHSMDQTLSEVDGLVNATPVGMFQYPGNPFPANFIGSQKWAFDAVYTPEWTEFLTLCQQKQMKCMTGFDLFFNQGIDAFEHFSQTKIDTNEALKLYQERRQHE